MGAGHCQWGGFTDRKNSSSQVIWLCPFRGVNDGWMDGQIRRKYIWISGNLFIMFSNKFHGKYFFNPFSGNLYTYKTYMKLILDIHDVEVSISAWVSHVMPLNDYKWQSSVAMMLWSSAPPVTLVSWTGVISHVMTLQQTFYMYYESFHMSGKYTNFIITFSKNLIFQYSLYFFPRLTHHGIVVSPSLCIMVQWGFWGTSIFMNIGAC